MEIKNPSLKAAYSRIPNYFESKITTGILPNGDNVTYFKIGLNASHDFFLGEDSEGNLWKADCCEESAFLSEIPEGEYWQPPYYYEIDGEKVCIFDLAEKAGMDFAEYFKANYADVAKVSYWPMRWHEVGNNFGYCGHW